MTGVSVSHHHATVEQIEAASPSDPTHALAALADHEAVFECLLVTTCNRIEWYVVTESSEAGRDVLETMLPDHLFPVAEWFDHDNAVEHLISVGAGLESMVLGEDEILGQLRRSYRTADELDTLGPLLEETVWKAIHCGERVRTETRINEGVTSLGRAAVMRATDAIELTGARALVVGAGEMATVAAHALVDEGIGSLTVANRTRTNADTLAAAVPIEAHSVGLETLPQALEAADVVISATASPEPVIDRGILPDALPQVIVDLGQPRDVSAEIADMNAVSHFDLDDIETVTRETNAEREAAAAIAAEMVEAAVDELTLRLKRRQADDVIAKMYDGAEDIKQRELEEAIQRLSAGNEPPEAILADFADAMVGHLLAAPTKSLRDAAATDDWRTIQTALRLFDPDFSDGRVSANRDRQESAAGSDPSSAER